MFDADLVLLHAPSVYDFRKKAVLYGPVSDVVPSTQIFEMYPLGFMTIMDYLQRHGHSVRIINVALKMLRSRRFNVEKLIKSLRPVAFGFDLHWLVHAQGSLALAEIAKGHHPDIPIIFGGISASYYHEELIRYPQVDYVVRGDSAEEPLRQLLSALKEKSPLKHVPNLTWKEGDSIRVNSLSHSPSDTDAVQFDYRVIMKSILWYMDFFGHMPYMEWFDYPIVAELSCHGCVHDCMICGGSASAFKKTCGRDAIAHRSPELLAKDIGLASRHMKAPIIILGDILQAGAEYANRLLEEIKTQNIGNHIAVEFFSPPPKKFLERIADSVSNFNIQISPESHDEDIRRRFGKPYDNASLEKMIENAFDVGCERIDIFFMIGLSGQTQRSVGDTLAYCRELLEQYGGDGSGKIQPFISPLAPFLDPGSKAFETPGEYGYRLFFRSLEDHRKALLSPSWKYTLNYETEWMSRDEIVASTYDAALELNRLKMEYGLIGSEIANRIEKRIESEKLAMDEIDGICSSLEGEDRERRLEEILKRFDCVGPSTICDKDEMKWPLRLLRFNPLRIMLGALTGG